MKPVACMKKSAVLLLNNPVILLASFMISVYTASLVALQPLANNTLASNLLTVIFFPFALGGTYGVIEKARKGDSDARTFISSGVNNYRPLFIGFLVVFVAPQLFLYGTRPIFGFLFGGEGESGLLMYGLDPSTLFLAISFYSAAIFVFPFTFLLLIQFYDASIVLDDTDAIESFRRSYRLVTQNFASVAGYTIIRIGLFVVMYLPAIIKVYLDAFQRTQQTRDAEATTQAIVDPGLATAIIASWTLLGAVLYTYHVVYYRELRE